MCLSLLEMVMLEIAAEESNFGYILDSGLTVYTFFAIL